MQAQLRLASPKIGPEDQAGVNGWTRYLAGYSAAFVRSATGYLHLSEKTRLLDPFVGSGTTCLVAKSEGIPSVGVEINPFAWAVARAKLCFNVTPEETKAWASQHLSQPPDVSGVQVEQFARWFEKGDPTPARIASVGRAIQETDPADLARLLLGALVLSIRKLSPAEVRWNPTWTPSKLRLPSIGYGEFLKLLEATAKTMATQLQFFASTAPGSSSAEILFGDFLQFENLGKFEAVITSPPYLSRLDYVMSFKPENDLLVDIQAIPFNDPEELRRRSIGSVKVVSNPPPDVSWGPTCSVILDRITQHKSKAARTYYLPTAAKYFEGLCAAVRRIGDCLAGDGRGLVVVQSSYFKDVEIPLGRVVTEMARNLGFASARIVYSEDVPFHRGRMDPQQRSYVSEKVLQEDVVLLDR